MLDDRGSDPTLHLPRILCLHGGGTNARIFRLQCRALERALRTSFRLVFAEGPFPAQPGPDVTAVYQNCGPFKAWLRIRPEDPAYDPATVIRRVNNSIAVAKRNDDYAGATGEWVGLLGFSQGAKLAASIIYSHRDTDACPYRFALLLAGRGPLVWLHPTKAIPRGLVDASQPTMSPLYESDCFLSSGPVVEHMLHVPTIHLHGRNDPGIDQHRKLLYGYCDPQRTTLVEWDGGHRVPIKIKDVKLVLDHVDFWARELGGFKTRRSTEDRHGRACGMSGAGAIGLESTILSCR